MLPSAGVHLHLGVAGLEGKAAQHKCLREGPAEGGHLISARWGATAAQRIATLMLMRAKDVQMLPSALAGAAERPLPQAQMLKLLLMHGAVHAALSSSAPQLVPPAYLHMCSNCA